jgi:type VI secretion system secreted protein Hcp
MAIYMNYNDLAVKGNVTTEGYEQWIRIENMSFGLGRHISMEAGHMSNREATRPNITEVALTKIMDGSSSGLFKESLTGSAGVKVLIDVVRTGADKLEKFVTYELEDVLISSYSISGSTESAPVESISLSMSKITMAYTAADGAHKGGTPERVGYDLALGKKL